ncbi:hypothetical protein MLD38_032474 [Melastoma candidum]|uniref:Uncharacterized protein n=1 Tax=Melastoma candidum TaxID=119954 RepID=A0ACB9M3U2_9MYRT|nr:hypothetical protein MLD38_032474 [Melastoma candidum]
MVEDLITRCLLMVLGYAYPAFQCFKSIEKRRVDDRELRFWCQFWILMAILTIVERVADVVISWLPMYGELKLAFIIYLWYPKTQGTGYIYETLLRPFITDHETDFETKLLIWRNRAWELSIYFMQNCSDLTQSFYFKFLEHMAGRSGNSSQVITKKNKKNPIPVPPPNTVPTFFKPGKNNKQYD